MARKSNNSLEEAANTNNSSKTSTSTEEIAALAYQLWQERGCPEGSAEEDWYEAQRKLQASR